MNIFFISVGYFFTLLVVSFDALKFLIFMKSNLSIFFLLTCAFGVILKINHCWDVKFLRLCEFFNFPSVDDF